MTGCFAKKPFFNFTENNLPAAQFGKSVFLIRLYGFRQNGEKESFFWHCEIGAPVIFEIENISEKIRPERENACAAVGVDVGRHTRCRRKSQAKPISFVMTDRYHVSGAKLRAPTIWLCAQCTISEAAARRNVKIITKVRVLERLKKQPHSGAGEWNQNICAHSAHQSIPKRFNLLYKARRLMPKIEAAFTLFPLTDARVILINSLSASARLMPS